MQNKHQFFFLVLGVPTLGEGGGSTWLGQIPKFFQKFDLKASLTGDRLHPCCSRIPWRLAQGGPRTAQKAAVSAGEAHWTGGRGDHQPPDDQSLHSSAEGALSPPAQQDTWSPCSWCWRRAVECKMSSDFIYVASVVWALLSFSLTMKCFSLLPHTLCQ